MYNLIGTCIQKFNGPNDSNQWCSGRFSLVEKLAGACPRGGGAAPPRNCKKKVIRANFKLFHLYFATFLVGNIIFSAIF